MAIGHHQIILLESLQGLLVDEVLFKYFFVYSTLYYSINLILVTLNLE